jgi:aldose 1-epimerase
MKPSVKTAPFGALADGRAVSLFTLTNAHGLVAKVINYGTILTELHAPDRAGHLGDVVLGCDTLSAYLAGHPYLGCSVGRFANRIARGRFTLDGRTYQLATNNGPNALHGGVCGFDHALFAAESLPGAAVQFTHVSPDGDQGYPGTLRLTLGMTLTEADELVLDYTATSDAATPLNLTNHSYFNLAGRGTIKQHRLEVAADCYTPKDANDVPTGEILTVRGTPLDFTRPVAIGKRFAELGGEPPGYDHNFVLRGGCPSPALAARLHEPKSGRMLEMLTTEPGVQVYTANWFDGSLTGKRGAKYPRHAGVALEAQHFPNSPNCQHFPDTILRPGRTYRQTTVYRFSVA